MEPRSDAAAVAELKAHARRRLRAQRHAMSSVGRADAAAGLAQQVSAWLERREQPAAPGLVAAYLSTEQEPGTGTLLTSLTEAGHEVVVPICEAEYQLTWCTWRPGVELHRSPRAPLLEPVGERQSLSELFREGALFSLVLVPGLAADLGGTRLGQGGGYYDRFLAQLATLQPDAPTHAFLFDHELLPAGTLPAASHDIQLVGAFTPQAFTRLNHPLPAV